MQPGEAGSIEQQGKKGSHRYCMRQKLTSSNDDYWIINALGSRVFFADVKSYRLREHLGFQDPQGKELAAILERVLRIKNTYSIYRNGNELATIKKTLITPVHQHFDVHVAGGENMEVQGSILDHEYEIHEGRNKRAEVSKKWFPIADTYGVEILPGADDILILAITVVIDMMIDNG